MSPTLFDASEKTRATRRRELEEELAEIKAEEESESGGTSHKHHDHSEKRSSKVKVLPEREEADSSESSDEPVRLTRSPREYSQVLRNETPNNGFMSSFFTQPPDMSFESQHEAEKILLVLRQHPIVNLQWVLLSLVLLLFPMFILPYIPLPDIFPPRFEFFGWIGWYLFITVYAIEGFISWYFNMYIITDERIIDIDFYSMIYKSVAEAKLEKVEDVTATTAGFLGAFLNYGNISIQTAAEKREFEFLKVPQPAKVTKFLNELLLEEEREKIEGRVM